jgi:hypothetical protein
MYIDNSKYTKAGRQQQENTTGRLLKWASAELPTSTMFASQQRELCFSISTAMAQGEDTKRKDNGRRQQAKETHPNKRGMELADSTYTY